MRLPITEENMKELELAIEEREGGPMSEHRRERARIVAKLINDAYYEGYKKATKENIK